MAVHFIDNMKAIYAVLPPFILSSVVKNLCNSWTTCRRSRDGHPYCCLGCYAVGGDDGRHYAFCPIVIDFISR
eukprot:8894821-Heterocapsa_arctica.AAC.1